MNLSELAHEEQSLRGKLNQLTPARTVAVKELERIDFETAAVRARLIELKELAHAALDATLAIGSPAAAETATVGGLTASAPVDAPPTEAPVDGPVDVSHLISVANVA